MLVHVAGVLQVFGYLSRRQLVLRQFLLAGTGFYIAYYLLAGPSPQWHAILWSTVFLVSNVFVIVLLYRDRRHGALTGDERKLAGVLHMLTPGQFRRLMRGAGWRTAAAETVLTVEGEQPQSLFFVVDGGIDIRKGERSFPVRPGLFIGEVAWLLDCPATATVALSEGARYVEWDVKALRVLFARQPDLKTAFETALNHDLARKVGAS